MMVATIGASEEEMEALLPWYATGALDISVSRRIEEALGRDTKFAAVHRNICDEMAETVSANEELGAPSPQTLDRLFAAIEAEPARAAASAPDTGFAATVTAFFASLSPRTLMYSASVAALAFIVQGGVIGSLVMTSPMSDRQSMTVPVSASSPVTTTPVTPAPAIATPPNSVTRSLGIEAPAENGIRVQIRFDQDAKMADIAQFLAANSASVVAGPKGGTFTVRFGNTSMSKDDIVTLVRSLERERIVSAISIAQ
jgi:hypothetical protein